MEKKTIAVLGMMCAGCAGNVERKLASLQGVASAAVNLPARTALVEYDENRITPEQMKAELAKIGFDMVIEDNRDVESIERRAYVALRRKVIVAWGLSLATIAVSMGWTDMGSAMAANVTMMLLAMGGMAYCGSRFYTSAWRQLRHATANMDTLVAMSTIISLAFSVFNTFWGERYWGSRGIEWHTYYDASMMIVTFVLTGRMLEERAKRGTASAIRSLMGLAPKTAHLVDGDTVTDAPLSALQPGDTIEVRPGEKIPVDGVVTAACKAAASTSAQVDAAAAAILIDESMISGEAHPVSKTAGDKVLAGTIVRQGTFRLQAKEVGVKTMLAHIIRMVQEAQGSKAPVQRVVDRIAMVFVPAVLCISVLTFVLWLAIGGTEVLPRAVLSAVSVLVIACPCAMGLATPTALMVGVGKAAQRNILIKDATALENMRHIDTIVMDKTGTLTHLVDNEEVLKPHAAEAMDTLQQSGIEVYMISGDKEENVAQRAHEAGIKHWQSRVVPQAKEDLVRRLQAEGHKVAMVGDGINDRQALAAADVSIAMGRGTDVAMDVAQITLMGTDLRRIPEAIDLSRKTVGMIHQNLFWAFIYNIVCIPLAAGALYSIVDFQITPMYASALMAMSSISVVMNSLRLKRK